MMAALVIAIAFVVVMYFARLRAAEGFFDKSNEPTVAITFSDTGVETLSDIGSSKLNWSVFEEILKFPDVWLLVYAKSGYITLPLAQLSSDCRKFIDDKMTRTTMAKTE